MSKLWLAAGKVVVVVEAVVVFVVEVAVVFVVVVGHPSQIDCQSCACR